MSCPGEGGFQQVGPHSHHKDGLEDNLQGGMPTRRPAEETMPATQKMAVSSSNPHLRILAEGSKCGQQLAKPNHSRAPATQLVTQTQRQDRLLFSSILTRQKGAGTGGQASTSQHRPRVGRGNSTLDMMRGPPRSPITRLTQSLCIPLYTDTFRPLPALP